MEEHEALRNEVTVLRAKLARAEEALRRRENELWLQHLRERDEAIRRAPVKPYSLRGAE